MLNDGAVNIDEVPLSHFGYSETEGGVDVGGDDEEEVEVEEVKRPRAVNYTVVEDEALIKAWESISLDSIHGTDQTRKRYWQRVEDKFFQLMPRNGTTVPRTFRSLQGRWDAIKMVMNLT